MTESVNDRVKREGGRKPEMAECHPERPNRSNGLCNSCYFYNYRYGITPDDIAGACALCGGSRRLVVDHDHITNVVRGTLCNKCNLILGLIEDDIDWLDRARQYLAGNL